MELTQQDKNHLYARAKFFSHTYNQSELNDSKMVVNQVFEDQVMKPLKMEFPEWNPVSMKKMTKSKKRALRLEWKKKVIEINYKWVLQMLEEDKSLVEKMTLFWHGHFACNTSKNPYTTLELNNLIRSNSLGNFKELLLAVSKSAGMINYLHLKQNKKLKPNEDFARELCELFTLGRDVDYTEKDIKEIARAFTGWSTNQNGDFYFSEKKHDAGEKVIFGQKGYFKGEDVLKLITDNKNTARFIASKIYRFFVEDNNDSKNIEEVATVLYESDYDIKATMKFIYNSSWFYESKGRIIKSPIDLLVGMGKMFDLKFPKKKIVIKYQKYLGQILFKPPNVAGWAGGRSWIDASRLAFRLRFGSLVLNQGSFQFELGADLDERPKGKVKSNYAKFYEVVDWNQFFTKSKSQSVFDVLIRTENTSLKEQFKGENKDSVVKLISTPDFQLT